MRLLARTVLTNNVKRSIQFFWKHIICYCAEISVSHELSVSHWTYQWKVSTGCVATYDSNLGYPKRRSYSSNFGVINNQERVQKGSYLGHDIVNCLPLQYPFLCAGLDFWAAFCCSCGWTDSRKLHQHSRLDDLDKLPMTELFRVNKVRHPKYHVSWWRACGRWLHLVHSAHECNAEMAPDSHHFLMIDLMHPPDHL